MNFYNVPYHHSFKKLKIHPKNVIVPIEKKTIMYNPTNASDPNTVLFNSDEVFHVVPSFHEKKIKIDYKKTLIHCI